MRSILLALALLAGLAPRPAAAEPLRSAATAAAVYGTLYVTAFVAVQAASAAILAVAPAASAGTALTFGLPAVMVVLMAQMVPTVRQEVPPLVQGLFPPEPAPAPR